MKKVQIVSSKSYVKAEDLIAGRKVHVADCPDLQTEMLFMPLFTEVIILRSNSLRYICEAICTKYIRLRTPFTKKERFEVEIPDLIIVTDVKPEKLKQLAYVELFV